MVRGGFTNGHSHMSVRTDSAPLRLLVVCPGKDKGSLFLMPITLDNKQELLFKLHSLAWKVHHKLLSNVS